MNQGAPNQRQPLLSAFGYVTAEDKSKWEQARSLQQQKHPGAIKELLSSTFSGISEIAQHGMQAQMRAVYQVHAEEARAQETQERLATIKQKVMARSEAVKTAEPVIEPEF